MGILRDLPIRISRLEFLITTTILRMEGLNEEYSMLLGRLDGHNKPRFTLNGIWTYSPYPWQGGY